MTGREPTLRKAQTQSRCEHDTPPEGSGRSQITIAVVIALAEPPSWCFASSVPSALALTRGLARGRLPLCTYKEGGAARHLQASAARLGASMRLGLLAPATESSGRQGPR
jgi:hypothetical protein